jgi:subtilisin family serine protease
LLTINIPGHEVSEMTNEVAVEAGLETTGRFVITFREDAQTKALALLKKSTGLTKAKLMSSAEFGETGVDIAQVPKDGGVIFEHLGIAVASMEEAAVGMLAQDLGDDSAILAIEPEGMMYALEKTKGLSLEYLRGFRDSANVLYAQASQGISAEELAEIAVAFGDTAALTWGLQATKAATSRFSGKGIKIAVLDTGLDLKHPDYSGRSIVSKSFISGVATAQDGHGHGTHCTGTACGPLNPGQGRRYGVAYGAQIFIGKVLSDQGSGGDIGILSGIDWAIANKCHVISLSLGATVQSTSTAYEIAGQRSLNAGTLIVAAAGNNAQRSAGNFGFVGRPANSRSFLAVGALDANLALGDFSARDTVLSAGTAVDIAGPGVAVYSSWPMPRRTRVISGTSMATPHVAGIAALWAQATPDRGAALWQRLITNASTLSKPIVDVGRGLVQAP